MTLSMDGAFKDLLKTAETAFKKLHENGKYSPKDLKNTLEYQNLMGETNAIFDKAVTDNVVDGTLLENLQNDVFMFSGLKTHAQLLEASRQLLDANNKIKPFSDFYKDVVKTNETYNRQYLEAEYQFAVASSQMANKWANFSDDYNLQYRTAGDDRVRDSHDKLRDTTLPKNDPFWDSFYAPNGWKCRCSVVEVLPEDYKVSDSKKAIAQGELATSQIGKDGKNKLAIFRFNAGKDKVVFPPSHPYSKVQGAKEVRDVLNKIDFKTTRNELIKKFVKGEVSVKRKELKKPITFTGSGIKEAVNQPHEFIKEKNKMLLNIDEILKNATYLGSKSDYKKNPMVTKIHIFETVINDKKTYLISRELKTGDVNFYSVSDNENVKKDIKK
ncbi:phage minor head protein [Microcoleus sp. herbarium8]